MMMLEARTSEKRRRVTILLKCETGLLQNKAREQGDGGSTKETSSHGSINTSTVTVQAPPESLVTE